MVGLVMQASGNIVDVDVKVSMLWCWKHQYRTSADNGEENRSEACLLYTSDAADE